MKTYNVKVTWIDANKIEVMAGIVKVRASSKDESLAIAGEDALEVALESRGPAWVRAHGIRLDAAEESGKPLAEIL